MRTSAWTWWSVLVCAFVSSCASVPSDGGFPEVEAAARERIDQRLHWRRGGEEDAEVDREIADMLAAELSVDTAVQIALLNNRDLQAVYEELGVAQAELVQAGLLENPVFTGELRFPSGGGATGVHLSLVEDFLSIFLLPLRKRIAGAAFEAAKARVTGAVLDLAGEARVAFYEYQSAQQLLGLRETVLAATEASYELMKRLHEAGNVRDLDLANERSLYEQSKLDFARAQIETSESRERVNSLLGLWGEMTLWKAAGRLPEPDAAALETEDVETRAIERSLDLAEVRSEIEAAGERLGFTRETRLYSTAEIGVAAEREAVEGTWSIGPTASFSLPIFSQGQPRVAMAIGEYRRLEQRFFALAVQIRSEVRSAASRLSSLGAQANYYRDVLLPLRGQIVEETQKQYNAMQVGAFQLLQAKREQIDAAGEYIETLREYWLARTALDQLLAGRRAHLDRAWPETMREGRHERIGDDERRFP